uniref:Integrase core domain containing protein n=1 Tax=Solanum tuberosum TaxID=4113 RepID=M1DN94_SOLTU
MIRRGVSEPTPKVPTQIIGAKVNQGRNYGNYNREVNYVRDGNYNRDNSYNRNNHGNRNERVGPYVPPRNREYGTMASKQAQVYTSGGKSKSISPSRRMVMNSSKDEKVPEATRDSSTAPGLRGTMPRTGDAHEPSRVEPVISAIELNRELVRKWLREKSTEVAEAAVNGAKRRTVVPLTGRRWTIIGPGQKADF